MIDYETRKQLEEPWLCEMAMTRQQAVELAKRDTFVLIVHIAKCFLFHDTQWYQHWLKECSNFCIKCDDIRLKPNNKRPTADFFLQDDFICGEWETAHDIKSVLDTAIYRCPEVEREDATDNEALIFLDLWNDLRYELANMFANGQSFDKSDYAELIDKYIKLYIEEEN